MIDKVVADRAPLAIARKRGEGAVLVSASEWASIEETLHPLRSPGSAKRLMEGVARFDAGKRRGARARSTVKVVFDPEALTEYLT